MRWRPGPTLALRHRGPRRWSCFRRVSDPGWRAHCPRGMSFREACDRGYLRPYDPQRVSDAGYAALGEQGAAQDTHEQDMTLRDGP